MFQELVVAVGGLVSQFETQFAAVALQHMEEEKQQATGSTMVTPIAPGGWNLIYTFVAK